MIEHSSSRNSSPRTSLPRSCYEAKASDPTPQSGMYYIDPHGQVNGEMLPFMSTVTWILVIHQKLYSLNNIIDLAVDRWPISSQCRNHFCVARHRRENGSDQLCRTGLLHPYSQIQRNTSADDDSG